MNHCSQQTRCLDAALTENHAGHGRLADTPHLQDAKIPECGILFANKQTFDELSLAMFLESKILIANDLENKAANIRDRLMFCAMLDTSLCSSRSQNPKA